MVKPVIRRCKRLNIIRHLDCQIFDSDYPVQLTENSIWWVVKVEGEVAGFAGLDLNFNHKEAFLCRCGILPKFRGKGLQKRLLKVRERYARTQNIKALWTYTSVHNVSSMNSLIKNGYKTYLPWDHDDTSDFIYWLKYL